MEILEAYDATGSFRAAAELARLTLPPDAGTQVSFHSPGDAQEPAREITVIVFSTAVAVDYFGGYADQAEACGTVEEGGRTLIRVADDGEGMARDDAVLAPDVDAVVASNAGL